MKQLEISTATNDLLSKLEANNTLIAQHKKALAELYAEDWELNKQVGEAFASFIQEEAVTDGDYQITLSEGGVWEVTVEGGYLDVLEPQNQIEKTVGQVSTAKNN